MAKFAFFGALFLSKLSSVCWFVFWLKRMKKYCSGLFIGFKCPRHHQTIRWLWVRVIACACFHCLSLAAFISFSAWYQQGLTVSKLGKQQAPLLQCYFSRPFGSPWPLVAVSVRGPTVHLRLSSQKLDVSSFSLCPSSPLLSSPISCCSSCPGSWRLQLLS